MADRYIHETELPAPNEACLEDIFLPMNYKPTREDVICSRGSISYHHGESDDDKRRDTKSPGSPMKCFSTRQDNILTLDVSYIVIFA